ncbi:hypothetical protein [Desulfobacula sp.]|uniref:hypothetical protein n=1 Tax=Desulfobacula sp. TaxID=2593537 RepID=UPI0039B97F33
MQKRFFVESFLNFIPGDIFFADSPLNSLGRIKIQAISSTKTRISLIPVKSNSLNNLA